MIYLAIKYHPDHKNKPLINAISQACEKAGLDCLCIAKDIEKWGENRFSPKTLMDISFDYIKKADFVLIEFSEKGVGIGIEAGYAAALGIPIYCLYPPTMDLSETLKGISTANFPYADLRDLPEIMNQIQTHYESG